MSVITKTGDEGYTTMASGLRVRKDDINSIGTLCALDRVVSELGYLCTLIDHGNVAPFKEIQRKLFSVGAMISSRQRPEKYIWNTDIDELELSVLEMENQMPPFKNFILPGGSPESAYTHVVRTSVRELESFYVGWLIMCPAEIKPEAQAVLRYLNRLSDYLFTSARYVNFLLDIEEEKV